MAQPGSSGAGWPAAAVMSETGCTEVRCGARAPRPPPPAHPPPPPPRAPRGRCRLPETEESLCLRQRRWLTDAAATPATPPGGAEQVLNQIVTGQSGLTQDTRLLSCLAGSSAQCCEAIVEYFGAAADFSGCQVGARRPGPLGNARRR